jgi:hypothetical protein
MVLKDLLLSAEGVASRKSGDRRMERSEPQGGLRVDLPELRWKVGRERLKDLGWRVGGDRTRVASPDFARLRRGTPKRPAFIVGSQVHGDQCRRSARRSDPAAAPSTALSRAALALDRPYGKYPRDTCGNSSTMLASGYAAIYKNEWSRQ